MGERYFLEHLYKIQICKLVILINSNDTASIKIYVRDDEIISYEQFGPYGSPTFFLTIILFEIIGKRRTISKEA